MSPAAASDPASDRPSARPRRIEVEDQRRRQLIEATIDCIADLGFGATTVAGIATRAGVSTGLVAFYFGDKAGVLEATLRHLASQLSAACIERLKAARSPRARIQAVVEACLEARQFDRRIATVWLAFWGEVPARPRFARVQRVYERRLVSNLVAGFRAYLARPDALRLAEATAALIDGLWLRATLSARPPDAAAARATVAAFVDGQIALLDLALLKGPAS